MVQCFQAVCTHKGVPFRFTLIAYSSGCCKRTRHKYVVLKLSAALAYAWSDLGAEVGKRLCPVARRSRRLRCRCARPQEMIYVWNGFNILAQQRALLVPVLAAIEATINSLLTHEGQRPRSASASKGAILTAFRRPEHPRRCHALPECLDPPQHGRGFFPGILKSIL